MADKVKLPRPVTTSEVYLAALVAELSRLNKTLDKLLANQAPAKADEVELREPAPAHRDAKQAASKVAKDAVGPVTVETVETVDAKKKG